MSAVKNRELKSGVPRGRSAPSSAARPRSPPSSVPLIPHSSPPPSKTKTLTLTSLIPPASSPTTTTVTVTVSTGIGIGIGTGTGTGTGRERERERDRDRERRERERDSDRRNRGREREEETKAREKARLDKLAEREREKELEAIKEQYLGSKKPKKRVIKPSEKFRFSFDWENTEDTSRDMNSLYQNPHEAQLLYGRGFRAGMDRREQKKLAAKHERGLREEIRRKEGVEERPEEALAQRQKEEAADLYDTFDMRVDRHWTEKKLEEMTERDWRIFREDFNISYKGSKIPRPMRSWAESKLTGELLRLSRGPGTRPHHQFRWPLFP
ncbi:hypothetical protein MLD38_025428 [Melastoma candidum]|uniref:Uncharacterized protein n=1 Tax=Melastoma candidum TaxID=119954 RepID=A0ACB9P295_9MYRT|nr:hypothetical protein MLD38_025428 [Melastoma candidum]